MPKSEVRIYIVVAILLLSAMALAQIKSKDIGRYQILQRENNRITIIDTSTGKMWESLPSLEVIERPSIDTNKQQ